MNSPQDNLPIWKRNLKSNGSSVPPAWAAFACDRKFEPRLSTLLTKTSYSQIFSFRIMCGADVIVQGEVEDFLVCIASARDKKVELTHLLPFSDLRIQFYYPNGKSIQFEVVKFGLDALDAPPPMDKSGAATGQSVGEAVARRRAVAPQGSNVRALARAVEFCGASAKGGGVGVDVVFCQAGVVAPPDSLTGGILSGIRTVATTVRVGN